MAERGRYLTPTDIKRSRGLTRVGTIDNDLHMNLAREWVIGCPSAPDSLGFQIARSKVTMEHLPFFGGGAIFNGVKAVALTWQGDNMFGRSTRILTHAALGLNQRTVPQAPANILAAVATLNNRLNKAVHYMARCPEILTVMLSDQPLDIVQAEGTPSARARKTAIFRRVGLDRVFQ